MSGFATGLAFQVYPAEFGQISQNLQTMQHQAAMAFAATSLKEKLLRRHSSVDTEHMASNADRDADGHAWGPFQRRKRKAPPEDHRLEHLAGEGTLFSSRA